MINFEMDKAQVVKVIITTNKRKGKGIESDPVRIVTQIWDLKGNLIAEIDPINK